MNNKDIYSDEFQNAFNTLYCKQIINTFNSKQLHLLLLI